MYSLLWLLAAALAWRRSVCCARDCGPAWRRLDRGRGLRALHPLLLSLRLYWHARLAGARTRAGPRSLAALLAAVTLALVAPWYARCRRVCAMACDRQLARPTAALAQVATRPSCSAGGCWRAAASGAGRPVDAALALAFLPCGARCWTAGGSPTVHGGATARVGLARRRGAGAVRLRYTPPHERVADHPLCLAGASRGPAAGGARGGPAAGRAHAVFVALILAAWSAGLWPIVAHRARPGAAYRALDAELEARTRPGDLVLVHSVPSGVIGTARYRDRPFIASWIAPLGLREVPRDLELLLRGRRRVALVQVHNLGAARAGLSLAPPHARLSGARIYNGDQERSMPISTTFTPDRARRCGSTRWSRSSTSSPPAMRPSRAAVDPRAAAIVHQGPPVGVGVHDRSGVSAGDVQESQVVDDEVGHGHAVQQPLGRLRRSSRTAA